ncbi:MAG: YedE-related selenium metabolism membrane protein [Nitrospirae bacterium]|nr:MAG: YedE-related selenium metabolism membrane protein [Nitrospirota bacterium]
MSPENWQVRVDRRIYILTGIVLGVGGVMLSYAGNPPNTGLCISCFMRNISGALALHDNLRMQYLRPELPAIVTGAFIASFLSGNFRPRTTGAGFTGFLGGMFMMIGCSVFIGCPVKMVLRLSGGDITALSGLAGLSTGVFLALRYLEGGFTTGKRFELPAKGGILFPVFWIGLLMLLVMEPGAFHSSIKGSAALHAPVVVSLIVGLFIGWVCQVSRFCITGGIARLFLWGPGESFSCPRSSGLLLAIGVFFLSGLVTAIFTGQFHPGIIGQPSSNGDYLWNAAGMAVVGFASVLLRGCPLRQLVRAGEGDTDAGITVLGMLVGATVVERWGIAGTADGTPLNGRIAVLLSSMILVLVATLMRERGRGFAPEFQKDLD